MCSKWPGRALHLMLKKGGINIVNRSRFGSCYHQLTTLAMNRYHCCALKHQLTTSRLPCCAVLTQAASFRLSHEKVFTPLVTLAILIQQNPQLALVRKSFPKVAQQLLNSVGGCCTP